MAKEIEIKKKQTPAKGKIKGELYACNMCCGILHKEGEHCLRCNNGVGERVWPLAKWKRRKRGVKKDEHKRDNVRGAGGIRGDSGGGNNNPAKEKKVKESTATAERLGRERDICLTCANPVCKYGECELIRRFRRENDRRKSKQVKGETGSVKRI
jgi:hypothetical protein